MRKFALILIWFAILGVMILQGCAPVAQEQKSPNTQIKFEPKLTDRDLPWESLQAKNYQAFFPAGESFVLSGSNLLNAFENVMWLGDAWNDGDVSSYGHQLVKDFYSNDDNVTVAAIEQSLYLEAALGEKKIVLMNLLRNKLVAMKNTYSVLDVIQPEMQVIANSVESIPLANLPGAIELLLDTYVLRLQQHNAAKDVWKKFKIIIDEKYRGPLAELQKAFGKISPNNSVTQNAENMMAVKKLPLDPGLLVTIDKELNNAILIDQDLKALDSSDKGVRVILGVWLMLDEEARKTQFGSISSALYWGMSQYSDDEIRAMRDNNTWWPQKMAVRGLFQAAVKLTGIETIKNKIAPALQKQLPEQFEARLKKEVRALPARIYQEVLTGIKDGEHFVSNLLVGTNYRKFFVDLSVAWGTRELFGGKTKTLGLERDRYVITSLEDGKLRIQPDEKIPKNSTSSAVIGTSLSMSGKRFERVSKYEGVTYDSTLYYTMVMEVLNKIPALGGFRKIDDELYPSFHILKNGRNPFEKTLDLKTQTNGTNYFAVPDFIALRPPYEMDREKTLKKGSQFQGQPDQDPLVQFGVYSQAELLRGLGSMIEFFRDWQVNGFDVKMSQYRLGDLIPDLPPHLEREMIFPKEKLFEYCLGIASVILENLKRDGSGLVLMNEKGETFFGEDLEKAKSAETLMAGMVDVRLDGREDTIGTTNLSKFILALGKFVESVEGFENSRSQLIHEVTGGEKKLLNRIKESVSLLRMLMAMMSNFLVQKMQRPDGTMDSLYSVKRGRVITTSRKLEDQVLAIQALLVTGERLGMGSYLGAAYDTYFGMNRVFYNDDHGFYSAIDRTWTPPSPYIFTEFMSALTKLSTKTDFSRGQINRLIGQFRGQLAH